MKENFTAKLSHDDMIAIAFEWNAIKEAEYALTQRRIDLAQKYGVSQSTIHKIVSGSYPRMKRVSA